MPLTTMSTPELTALRTLLDTQPVAALATLHHGEPAVSMVPFALLPDGAGVVIHVSQLATHTQDMLAQPAVSLLVTAPLSPDVSPLALPRASLRGVARPCPAEAVEYAAARAAYLARLPDSEALFAFADFSLFLIAVNAVRYVAGFGRAHALTASQFVALMGGSEAG